MAVNNLLTIEYSWKKGIWNRISAVANNKLLDIKPGNEEEFITEHYWGYTKSRKGTTSEYNVEHPQWQVYDVINYSVEVDFESTYGNDFAFLTQQKPVSVFLAEGSDIKVNTKRLL